MRKKNRSGISQITILISMVILLPLVMGGKQGVAEIVVPEYHGEYVPNEILVHYSETDSREKRQNARSSVRAKVLKEYQNLNVEHWIVPGSSVEDTITELVESGVVDYAEPNYYRYQRVVPDDTNYDYLWGLNNTGQEVNDVIGIAGSHMNMQNAWDLSTGSAGVVVAVIDNGVQTAHPDLAANIVAGKDLENDDTNPNPDISTHIHGTLVSGVLGAVGNNGEGITGVAWNVSIMPLKFGGDIASEVLAIDEAISEDVDIVNFSYGGTSYSQTEKEAIDRLETAGILLVVAAGNTEVDNDLITDYPSCFENKNIISVASSDQSDILSTWSQYGQTSVDVMAPGENVYTTTTGSAYKFVDGTSFSAPYVAGVAALIKSYIPAATYQEIKGRIMAGADANATTINYMAVNGRVDAYDALTVSATPVVVLKQITIDDSGNGMLDPGETTDLVIELENTWSEAKGVNAVLSTTDADVTINTSNASYSDISSGASSSSSIPFNITLSSEVSGNKKIQFSLAVSDTFGYSVTRYFIVETGKMISNTKYNDIIQTNDQDDIHHYYISVPSSADVLVVKTESCEDIDVLVKKDSFPIFLMDGVYGYDDDAAVGKGTSGYESVSVDTSGSATYHIAVVNHSAVKNEPYCISAISSSTGGNVVGGGTCDIPACDGEDSGGGGGASWFFFLVPFFFIKRKQK